MERTIFWSTIETQGTVMTSFDKVFKVLQANGDVEKLTVVERTFSFQNLIFSARRNRLLLDTVSKKILLKYCKLILSKEEINKIIETAALPGSTRRNKKKFQASLHSECLFLAGFNCNELFKFDEL